MNMESDPKALTSLAEKAVVAKKALDDAKLALEKIQNAASPEYKNRKASDLEAIPELPGLGTPGSVDASDVIKGQKEKELRLS